MTDIVFIFLKLAPFFVLISPLILLIRKWVYRSIYKKVIHDRYKLLKFIEEEDKGRGVSLQELAETIKRRTGYDFYKVGLGSSGKRSLFSKGVPRRMSTQLYLLVEDGFLIKKDHYYYPANKTQRSKDAFF